MKLLLVILLAYVMISCDLLDTREPEKPDAPRTNFITPTTPDLLFQNLSESLKEKVVENYMSCFVDESFLETKYKFIPSAGSIAQFNILADWDLNSERQYFNNLQSATQTGVPIILQLLNEINQPYGDSAVYQYDYILSIPLEGESVTYQGSAQFNIRVDSRNYWVITEWEDTKKENSPSWSELKGRYY